MTNLVSRRIWGWGTPKQMAALADVISAMLGEVKFR